MQEGRQLPERDQKMICLAIFLFVVRYTHYNSEYILSSIYRGCSILHPGYTPCLSRDTTSYIICQSIGQTHSRFSQTSENCGQSIGLTEHYQLFRL